MSYDIYKDEEFAKTSVFDKELLENPQDVMDSFCLEDILSSIGDFDFVLGIGNNRFLVFSHLHSKTELADMFPNNGGVSAYVEERDTPYKGDRYYVVEIDGADYFEDDDKDV